MKALFILLGVLAALKVVGFLVVRLAVPLFGRAIGAKAVAAQPDRIHLCRSSRQAWKDADAADALARPLLAAGFDDAGVHTITEMPGVVVHLLARSSGSLYAAVHEHPQGGRWLDIVTRYQDGTSASFSTLAATGLAPRPGHLAVNAPETEPAALLARALNERPRGMMKAARMENAVRDYEQAYAEYMEWRRATPITTAEVAAVAARMKERAAA